MADICPLCPELRSEIEWYRAQLEKRDATIADLTARILAVADPMTALRMQALQQRMMPAVRAEADSQAGEPRKRGKGRQFSPARIRNSRPDRMGEDELAAARRNLKAAVDGTPPEKTGSAGPAAREAIEAGFERALRPLDERAG